MPPRRRTPKRKSGKRSKRSKAATKGWETRRRRASAQQRAREWATRERQAPDEDVDDRDPDAMFPWDRPGWVPEGGWQGDEMAEEISFMTHEEKIEFFEWLAEELDTTVHELFEMYAYGEDTT